MKINPFLLFHTHKKLRNMVNSQRLLKEDLHLSCRDMAVYLLGKVLVRKLGDGSILKGRIVETECYLGGEDKASNSRGGRRTPGNAPMYMPSGTAYVYMTYGMYFCFNISSKEEGAAVLLRALEPIHGQDMMQQFRTAKRKIKSLKDAELCNGPSKLCMAMDIRKDTCNTLDLAGDNDELWLEDDGCNVDKESIITTARIGIASAGVEWASKPLRFYVLSNPHVSKRDKVAEKDLCIT